ncbi:SusC/RagA family TonB-linked outer membrane protein [Proteiniphilum acetatigenes]|uniref:SusC/RagA family TonB-linked outer membrane protein n=1 Tax=Proteiniphilum acetatigenes TaxID=294710 RepID=UPI0003A87E30|nr:TonB-dependent receptor [Proteiniphilum acetatigenes]
MKKKLNFLLCILLLFPFCLSAQEKLVNGKVIESETGEPLPGATVQIENSTRGVTTDIDGTFEIRATSSDKLVISFLGLESQTIAVGSQTYIEVVMSQAASELDEVTIVAFGKQKKESVIGSITTVRPDDLKVPSSNLTTALAGRMSGLIAYQRSGEPGLDNAEFFIRGVTTFGYKKDPLILIDNNESSSTELARMQPDDIASFSILKDATATALYGSRGANGVILVSTKEGREGKAKINVRFEEAFSQPTKMVEMADPVTYMKLHNEAIRTRDPLGKLMYSEHKIQNTIDGTNPYVYPATDWYDMLFKDYSNNHRLNLNVSGGGKIARYYLAGSIINDNGVLNVDKKNNFNNNVKLNRYMLRSNVNINITPTTEAIVRLSGAFDDYKGPPEGGQRIFQMVMHTNPVLFPPYYAPDAANEYTEHVLFGNYDNMQYYNPYAEMVKGYKEYSESQMSAQFELKQDLTFITEGLSFRAMFNTNRYAYFDVVRQYTPFYYTVGSYNKEKNTYTLSPLNEEQGTDYLSYNEGPKNVHAVTYFESALTWNREFDKIHDVGALLVYTVRNELIGNAGDLQKSLPYRNMNFAGRFTYSYDSRYLFEGNFGYNGSERFSKAERFGFFPSAGIGWNVSNESFYGDGLRKIVSSLKLKSTYGLSGNDAIGDANDRFFYLSNVNMNSDSHRSSFGTFGNSGGLSKSGIAVSRYANDLITWETSKKFNVTAEIGLFEKIDIQAEYFKEDRNNILMDRAFIPSTMGLQAPSRSNVGEAAAHGVDISVNLNHSFNKDTWISGIANFTYATSEFKVYEEPDYPNAPWRSRIGYPLTQTWGYIAERLFVDEEEVRNSPTQFGNYKAGDIKYKDLNGDGKITELDMAPIGYPTTPEITYGFGLSSGHKKFDFSFFFQGNARTSFWLATYNDFNNGVVDVTPFIGGQQGLLKAIADSHWSETNRDIYAMWPRLSPSSIENNNKTSTWLMRDGTFLRLKSVELGYTLPDHLASKTHMSNLRIYISGTNLLTFSKFKLWDPEMGGNGLGYPVQRVANVGIQLGF